MKWFIFAARNVMRSKRRSAVTVLIIAVGAAAILVAAGFGLYTYESLQERTARELGHVVIAHRDYFSRDEDLPMALGLEGHEALRATLARDRRVRYVASRIEFAGLISNGEKSAIFLGTGVDPGVEFRVSGPFLDVHAGRVLEPHGHDGADPEVMLGRDLANSLRAVVGSNLTLLATTSEGALNAIDVRVVGIFSTGKPELDARKALISIAAAQHLLATERVSTVAAYLRDTEQTDGMSRELRRALPDLAVKTWEDLAFYYLKVKALYDRIFGVLGAIIVIMVFFAVTNTLSMTVVERTREIGTLAAMGTFRGEIVRGFVLEAVLIGVAGTFLGVALSAAVAFGLLLLEVRMPPPPGMTTGYPLFVAFSPLLSVITSAALIAVSALAAYLAARRGAATRIVEALAHV